MTTLPLTEASHDFAAREARRKMLLRFALLALIMSALVAAPLVIYPILMKVLCFALFASAVNLLLGYVGLLSFGHAMYFGGAAYASGYLVKTYHLTPELGILGGTLFAAMLGAVTGRLAIRNSGIYFAMITLSLGQLFYFACLQAPMTGGEDGIQNVPRGMLLGFIDLNNNMAMYYTVLGICAFGFFVVYRTVNSPFGQILKAIRENETRAVSLGYRVDGYKATAFVISATIAGLAGATKVLVFELASLTDVAGPMSGEVVLMTLLGGMGTIWGPAVGAAFLVTMQNYLASIGEWLIVVQGLIFILVISLFRRGLVGEIEAFIARRRSRP